MTDTSWLNDLDPELRAKVDELTQAFASEFMSSEETRRTEALTDLEQCKGDALAAIKYVLQHADNLNVKSKVAMWTYEKLLDQGKATKDPLVDMMKEIEEARARASAT